MDQSINASLINLDQRSKASPPASRNCSPSPDPMFLPPKRLPIAPAMLMALTCLNAEAAEFPGGLALHFLDAVLADRFPVHELSDTVPTQRVNSPIELRDVLASDFKGRVVVPQGIDWVMENPCGAFDEFGRCVPTPITELTIQSGVQLIGERGPLGSRPALRARSLNNAYALFSVPGNDVVVQGLHFQGPEDGKRDTASLPHVQFGVRVIPDPNAQTGRNIVIRDNEFDEWPGAGVNVEGTVRFWDPEGHITGPLYTPADAHLIRVERNYFHHNARDNAGYGVQVGGNAHLTIEGNVFDFNRHAIASSGLAFAGYVAKFNYVLQGGYTYGNGYFGQHFDVHGSGTSENHDDGHYDGGAAGEKYLVAFNTFRGEQNYGGFLGFREKTRAAFELRGRPAIGAEFTDNVLVHDNPSEAIRLKSGGDPRLNPPSLETFNLVAERNQYDRDYATEIAAGDFDGDGHADVFVANGTGWFYSRAGIMPWEFLHASTKRRHQLAFADIDNDHRTDVLYRDDAGNLGYLRAGQGNLFPLTTLPVPIAELRFGDFDADGLTDLFYTQDGVWHLWSGATRAWEAVGGSSKPISELLFGNFDDVPGTDVAGINRDGWAYSSGARGRWVRFNRRLSSSFSNAIAIDLDGRGFTDILIEEDGERWNMSRDGRGPLV